jgi:hypothetical protein
MYSISRFSFIIKLFFISFSIIFWKFSSEYLSSISLNVQEISSRNTDCNRIFCPLEAGKDKNKFSFALVKATKNSLLSSSICSKFVFCNQSQEI